MYQIALFILQNYLLRMPLSDIITSSYLAASYPGYMLFIFGLTPTSEPPANINSKCTVQICQSAGNAMKSTYQWRVLNRSWDISASTFQRDLQPGQIYPQCKIEARTAEKQTYSILIYSTVDKLWIRQGNLVDRKASNLTIIPWRTSIVICKWCEYWYHVERVCARLNCASGGQCGIYYELKCICKCKNALCKNRPW